MTTERIETETRQQLNNKIEHLEAELASMKARLEQEVAQRHALGRTMDVCRVYTLKAFVLAYTHTSATGECLLCHAVTRLQAQLLEAKKQLETQNTLQQKTRELLRGSEQQVVVLKAQLASASASSSEAGATSSNTATPAGRATSLRAPLRGKEQICKILIISTDAQILLKLFSYTKQGSCRISNKHFKIYGNCYYVIFAHETS